jgi:hypothetical protein
MKQGRTNNQAEDGKMKTITMAGNYGVSLAIWEYRLTGVKSFIFDALNKRKELRDSVKDIPARSFESVYLAECNH